MAVVRSMPGKDRLGLHVSGATEASIAHCDAALALLQCHRAGPRLCDGPCAEGLVHPLGTKAEALPVAQGRLSDARAAAGRTATGHEFGHIAANDSMSAGHFLRVGRSLEDVAIRYPLDGLALLASRQIDFLTGQSRLMRDRIARARPGLDANMPGFHSLLGMQAFRMEEMGDHAQADAAGRRGVELEARNGRSQHVVAHVLEMQGRHEDGVCWMAGNTLGRSGDSLFQVHSWRHLCLYPPPVLQS